ncbi:ROK family protein [Mycolicibacterium confluentis]|uniref:Sugar kinase n=1 Tax=Mycolicibacterium confluentis TaxID=28047 RepID=A0A7I7Y069_9MYCO|nr:ROK family protein [Mycolicibacterium confluentis]MCV7319521.1 ROK family protein [Mycolicibacterium confluentis]ORV34148.1 ROK family transcriptional regulator [Mycolicibacterium confluentis]BBZ34541.1 sugar kinase [Mycolicibacterium confluentis]
MPVLRRSSHLRSASVGELFALIRDGVATTRSELRHATGLSRTAVAARVAALTECGLVVEHDEGPSTGGRPPALLRFNADAGVVAAVAIGRSRTHLAVTDLAGHVQAHADVDLDGAPGPDELMPNLVTRLEALLTESGHEFAEVRGIGVSLPGTVDLAAGASLDSPVMNGWDGIALAPYFSGLTSAPVIADNDANAMALAEWRGGHRDVGNLLLLKLSTGLGAGIIAGGALQRGAVGAAGEFGHNKVAAAQGVLCRCGDTGCLEAIAGGWPMVRTLQQQGHPVHHVRDVVELAHRGEPEARRLLRDSGRHIGEAIAAAVNLLNPAVLVIGGDMTGAYDILVAGLRETLYGNATALATRTLQVVPASFGDRSAAQGSAVLVLDHILSVDAVDATLSD